MGFRRCRRSFDVVTRSTRKVRELASRGKVYILVFLYRFLELPVGFKFETKSRSNLKSKLVSHC